MADSIEELEVECKVRYNDIFERVNVLEKKIKMLCDSMHVEFRDGLHLVDKDSI